MAIKIHHGPNGSYKTSGAIQDDAVPALKDGRLIITNVRGFTLERVLQVFPSLPEATEIINLSLESLDDMERMRTWFQWAPRGAFIIFDETQLVFPKAWREKDLERFDCPGGPEAASEADRPMSWLDGWTRHRHWNWDIVLTTPNISYIRDDIRMTCETAYRHSNLAVIGIKGRYKEAQHDAQQNRAPADGTIVEYKRIKPETFKLYLSTATGKSQDTSAGKSLFKSPRILLLLALMAGSIGYFFLSGGTAIITDGVGTNSNPGAAHKPVPAGPVVADTVRPDTPRAASVPSLAGEQGDTPSPVLSHPFSGLTLYIDGVVEGVREGKFRRRVLFKVVDQEGKVFSQTLEQLSALGYMVGYRGPCYVELFYNGWEGSAICQGSTPQPAQIASSPSSGGTPNHSPSSPPPSESPPGYELANATRVTVVSQSK